MEAVAHNKHNIKNPKRNNENIYEKQTNKQQQHGRMDRVSESGWKRDKLVYQTFARNEKKKKENENYSLQK